MITDTMQEINLFFCGEKRNVVFSLVRLQNQQTSTTHNPVWTWFPIDSIQ